MKNIEKTQKQFIEELEELQQRNKELEISEIKRMQKEQILRESEKKYRLLVESSADMMFIVDLKGNFLFVNKAFKKSLGYSKKEMRRISGFALVHPDDLEKVKSHFAQIISGKTVNNMEYRYKTKDCQFIHILNNAAPISDSQGNVVAALGIARDISLRKRMEEELQRAHGELEQRVATRTEELLRANERLNREIVERKRIEKELRKSEEKYRTIFESFHDVYYQTDKEGLVTIISPSVRPRAGWDPEDIIGNPVTDFFLNPDDRDMMIQKLKESGAVNDYELKLKAKDGKVVETSVSAQIMLGKDKQPIGVEGVLRDITERKLAEEALRESEEKYRAIFESIYDVYFRIDHHNTITLISPSVRIQAGWDPEEIIGKPVTDFYFDPSDHETIMKKLIESGSVNDYELKLLSKDGSVIETSASGNLVYDKNGKFKGVEGLLRNITERKRAEEELQAREAYLNHLIDGAQEAIVMADNEGKARRINKEFTKLFGYTQKETEGRVLDEMIVPEKLKESAQSITKKVSGGKGVSFEALRCSKNKTLIDVSVLASPIVVSGKQVGTYGIYRDITEQKKTEEQIKNSLKEKEILLQEIHHRVKNNMQIVSSLLNLQSRHIKDKQSLGLFKSSQNRVKSMALIHERLYQSKDFNRIDVADYVQGLINHLFITFGVDKQIVSLKINIKNMFLSVDAAIPCGLIINELVSNSLKYAFPNQKKGEIKISMHPLGTKEVKLVVSDNGVGMPAEMDLKKTSSLGLNLVSMLAEDQLHGEIKLDKKRGTSFRFRLRVKNNLEKDRDRKIPVKKHSYLKKTA